MAGSVKRNAYMEMALQGEQKKAAATMTQVATPTPTHSPANGRLVKELHSTSAALHKHRETGKPSVDVGQHTSHQVEMGKQKEKWETTESTLKDAAVAAYDAVAAVPEIAHNAKKTGGFLGLNKKKSVDHPALKTQIMLGGRRKRTRARKR